MEPLAPHAAQRFEAAVHPAPDSAPADRAAAARPDAFGRVLANLLLLIALGVGLSAWVLYYTDWFPVVGGLLGLGGLFAWVAFVSGLLTDDRKEQFQERFDRQFLQAGWAWKLVLGIGVACLLFASTHGTVVLDSSSDDRERVVGIGWDPAGEHGDAAALAPRTRQKHLVWTGWRTRPVWIKVSGLPAVEARVAPLRRGVLGVPAAFSAHPALLIRPAARVSANAESFPFKLVVRRRPAGAVGAPRVIGTIERDRYRGESVWVGCDADVQVPDSLLGRWRLGLLRDGTPEEALVRWSAPLAVAEREVLAPGDSVEAALLRSDGSTYTSGAAVVRRPSPGQGFAQEIQLPVPLAPSAGLATGFPPSDSTTVPTLAEDPADAFQEPH